MSSGDITCRFCEARIDVSADVCPECGARTDVISSMRAGEEASGVAETDTTTTTDCPDCGAEVSGSAVRCPQCFADLDGTSDGDRPSLAGRGEAAPRPTGYWHVAVAAGMLAGAVGLVLTLALPETAGAGDAGGWLVLANIVLVPVATYLDVGRLRTAAGWEPQTAVWVGLGIVPGVNVASGFVYLVRRNDAAAAGSG